MQDQSGFSPYLFNIKNGQRASTADAYLRPALKRDNLDVVLNTQVRKILFDDNRRAIGIEATQNHGETIFEVRNSARCLKITKKVAFNIASEASCVYILIGQNWWKVPKLKNWNATFWVIFKHCEEEAADESNRGSDKIVLGI